MELSALWGLEQFFEDIQRTIIKRRLMNPWTLEESKFNYVDLFPCFSKPFLFIYFLDRLLNSTYQLVRSAAERVNAEVLLRQCEEYAEKNVEYIRKVQSLNVSSSS